MKKLTFILSREDLVSEIPKIPLVVFKLGLAVVVLIQALGYLMEAPLIFNRSGLFPDSLVHLYFPSGFFEFGNFGGAAISSLLIVLAVASLFRRSQNPSFLAIFVLELVLWIRNFTFLNFGDYALLILSLFAGLLPTATWRQRNEKIQVLEIAPLYLLSFIIYLMNGIFKLSSSWAQGSGLKETLSHLEMVRFPTLAQLNYDFTAANYTTIVTVFLIALAPLISFRFSRLRNSLILLSLGYHLVANIFINLSWLSLPFILLQASLWLPALSTSNENTSLAPLKPAQAVAFALLLVGFFGIRDPIGIYAFGETQNPLLGHNWYMFAPPPLMTGQWQALISTNDEAKILSQRDLEEPFDFFYFQHKYKFFYNLRKTEMLPLVIHFSAIMCTKMKEQGKPASTIQLTYSGRLFRTGEDFQVSYPEVRCE